MRLKGYCKTMEMKMKHRLTGAVMVAVLAGGIVGCAKEEPYRSSGRVMDDRMVNKRVKSALEESPVYKFPHVDATTYNGVVQLNGFVYREEQKNVAGELARSIDGVREVVNNISVVPPEQAYGGTVDTKAGTRGTGANQPPPSAQRNTSQNK